jgi:hypothetical protein
VVARLVSSGYRSPGIVLNFQRAGLVTLFLLLDAGSRKQHKTGEKNIVSLYMARMCAPRAKMGVRPQEIFGGKLLYGRE